MERCPLCDSVGTVQNTASGVPGCSRCAWTLDGSPPPPRAFIPTWKVQALVVVPIVVLWVLWTHSSVVGAPWLELARGLTILLMGVWSGVCAHLWERLTPAFRERWLLPHRLTPAVLAVVFCLMGGMETVKAAVMLIH